MIVKTKLYIPHKRHDSVPRPRLMRKLDEGLEAKLILISASAGYGKTTALSEWARQSGVAVAWVSLDKQDDEWIAFWTYVTSSIQEQAPGFAQTVLPLLANGPSASFASSEPAVTAMLNELNQLPGELAIVLDDFHCIELPEIQRSLSYFVDRLPPQIHLYIASRTDLPIPTARLMAKGEMRQIRIQDLRFHPEEGHAFFRKTAGLSLSREQFAELYHQTEGWISGLQLAALSLKRSDNIAESIRQFSGHQTHISDYLLEEVYLHLPESTRAFMLQTSILTRMNHSLCEAATGQANAQEQLERLEQWNLFITPLDDQRNWYRYHHLMSDFLRRMFIRTNPGQWARTHVQAARWLESHGFEEEAAEHYLEGKQYEDVVRVIENNLQAFLKKKFAALSRWILQLPESVISKRPMVEMFYLLLLIGIRQWDKASEKIERAKLRYDALQGTMDDAEWKNVMGNICYLCATSSYFKKDLTQVSDYFELVDQYAPEGSFLQTIGDNRYNGYDEFEDHLTFINDYHGASVFLLKWITRWGDRRTHPFAGRIQASYSKLLYEWNRLEEAERCIDQVLRPQDAPPNTRSMLQINVSASRIQQALGHPVQAAELLERLKVQIESPDYAVFLRKIEAEQACLAVRQGSLPAAAEWLERCGMTPTDEIPLNEAAEYAALARVLAACGRMDEALSLSERLQQLFWKEDRLRERIKMLILQSVTQYRGGQKNKAIGLLETALRLAWPQRFVRSFVDEGPVMAEILTAYLSARQDDRLRSAASVPPDYAVSLLQALQLSRHQSAVPVRAEARRARKPQIERLTNRQMEIVRLMAEGMSNKQIAQDLDITEGTVKSHANHIYEKLDVRTRVQAIKKARELLLLN
ncbi:LuxR C-terminal-related transcriptional regulator [Cohnella cellulosilytica]|uniref:LuxR C-terminal-related transcriptional regulator n=1 Tax=Cohnella cellulosilytica TaxID=986710 RepID=UPI0035F0CCCE